MSLDLLKNDSTSLDFLEPFNFQIGDMKETGDLMTFFNIHMYVEKKNVFLIRNCVGDLWSQSQINKRVYYQGEYERFNKLVFNWMMKNK